MGPAERLYPHMAKSPENDAPPAPPRTRDQELVRFVGRHGLVAMRHAMAALGVGRTAAYRRVTACIEAGLLSASTFFARSPASCARPVPDSATQVSGCHWRRPRRAS